MTPSVTICEIRHEAEMRRRSRAAQALPGKPVQALVAPVPGRRGEHESDRGAGRLDEAGFERRDHRVRGADADEAEVATVSPGRMTATASSTGTTLLPQAMIAPAQSV